MIKLRLVHFYLCVFFAPLIIFYAFTGVLQVFKLHETYLQVPGSQGNWVAWFGEFHKEQAWIPPRVAPAKKPAQGGSPQHEKDDAATPMKWMVAAMGVALMLTTTLGLYIAYSFPKRRRVFVVALGAGILVPLALMAF